MKGIIKIEYTVEFDGDMEEAKDMAARSIPRHIDNYSSSAKGGTSIKFKTGQVMLARQYK